MENHFYHIKLPPLNVTIRITHVRNLRYVCYPDDLEQIRSSLVSQYVNVSIEKTQNVASPI